MRIRPADLAEVRASLVRQRDAIGPAGVAYLHNGSTPQTMLPGLSDIDIAVRETTKLVMADLFHVSDDMTQLAIAASRTLPPFASDALDYPASIGFMFFNGGIPADWGGHPVRVHAASWQVLGTGAMIAWFLDLQSVIDVLQDPEAVRQLHVLGATGDGLWFNDVVRIYSGFNTGVDAAEAAEFTSQSGIGATAMPVLRAAMLLMQQPLAEVSTVTPDRAARNRLRREGVEPPPVRVIELRRPKRSDSSPGESGREYHHSWIVRGHWRQQWYPTREVHRPVWIAPHLKGPEGAPLIGGEKVYAFKR